MRVQSPILIRVYVEAKEEREMDTTLRLPLTVSVLG